MRNPFKKHFRIIEHTNQNGSKYCEVIYCSDFVYLFRWLDLIIYIGTYDSLTNHWSARNFSSPAEAIRRIEDYKQYLIDESKRAFKKSAVHYVD